MQADSLQLSKDEMAMMATTRATVTPLWKGFATLVRYRTAANHRNVDFLMQRFSDKIIFSTLMATLYLGIGSDLVEKNYINIAAVLFMWSVMPACAPAPPKHAALAPCCVLGLRDAVCTHVYLCTHSSGAAASADAGRCCRASSPAAFGPNQPFCIDCIPTVIHHFYRIVYHLSSSSVLLLL